jgi:hypothetical protein
MSRNTIFSDNESSWSGLFGSTAFLGIGLLLVLFNVGGFLVAGVKPGTLLFYLNMRFWSVYASIALWTIVIWLVAESLEFLEDYLPFVRIAAGGCVLLVIILALRSSVGAVSGASLWFPAVVVITVCCAIRSLFMLYNYWCEGGDAIDMEEAQWFWGMSGFLAATLIIMGMMSMIHLKEPMQPGSDVFLSESLYASCKNALEELLRNGSGPAAIRLLGFLIFVASATFAFVAGKWMLLFWYKMRGN